MLPVNEENFPRGGSKPHHAKLVKKPENLFSISVDNVQKKKRKRKEVQQKEKTVEEDLSADITSVLSYKNVQEDMLVLGNVRKIHAVSIDIELPGKVYGCLKIDSVSDQFIQLLQKQLKGDSTENDGVLKLRNFFTIGQFLPVKVLQVLNTGDSVSLELSTRPAVINQDLNHRSFRKGMLIWAAIAEVLDHGYRLDVGRSEVRVFLPSKNVEEDKTYRIGELLWCVVHVCNISPTATTLRVSARLSHIAATVEDEEDRSLHSVIPGMQCDFEITKVLKNGLQGNILGQHKAYINELFLSQPLEKLDKYQEDQVVRARVLYIEPITKFVYLTLRGIEKVPRQSLDIGQIINAQIISHGKGGIYLKLNEDGIGFVTYRRILNNEKKQLDTVGVGDIIQQKYPVNRRLDCRILDYSRMDCVYICTVEESVLHDSYFTADNLTLGQLVEAKVVQIKDDGLVLKLGRLSGFVENVHLSNALYTKNIKSKFRINQKVKARILKIFSKESIRLTLKPMLVESDLCLSDYSLAVPGKQFPGIVVLCTPAGVLVAFYGKVKGWIPTSNILAHVDKQQVDPKNLFFVGQVVQPTIVNVQNERMTLSLLTTPSIKIKPLLVGEEVNATVCKILENGMEVQVQNKNVLAFIPLHHLSVNYDLNSILLGTYKEQETVENVMCISNGNGPILSVRESIAYSKQNLTVPKFANLKNGALIRCSFVSQNNKRVIVTSPVIKNKTNKFEIQKEELIDHSRNNDKLTFVDGQAIVAKVIEANKNNTLKLAAKMSQVFDHNLESTFFVLEQYLINIQRIKEHMLVNGKPIAELELGQRVSCVVNKIGGNGGCSVFVSNYVQGLVDVYHCPKNLKQGQSIEGVILWIDYVKGYVELSCKQDIIQRINAVQDGIIDKSFICTDIAEILLIRENFVLGVTKCKKQLVFLPTRLHENDYTGIAETYKKFVNEKVKILLYRKVGGCLIGFLKRINTELLKKRKQLIRNRGESQSLKQSEVKKRKRHNSETDSEESKRNKPNDSSDTEDEATCNGSSNQNGVSKGTKRRNNEISIADCKQITVATAISKGNSNKRPAEKIVTATSGSESKVRKVTGEISEEFDIAKCNTPCLPGIRSFYSEKSNSVQEECSSSDSETEQDIAVTKKKKLTSAERAELARQEEERILKIENELADSNATPQSAEQFDRLLLANPNASNIWAQYVAFHLSNTEVEKARGVIKRALENISMEKIQEKLNIWLVSLNLENMCGTKESFENIFEEAVKYNDPYVIYVEVIKSLAKSNKFDEMDEKIKKFRSKYKNMSKAWIELSRVYFSIGKLKEARALKESAFRSITDKHEQMNMLVQFAIFEFKYGEQSQGELLFENILESYPGRVDVWCSYVDQLIKKGSIDLARRVLERSVCQKLSVMKIRSLFRKYQAFEKAHGTPETLDHVKTALMDYISTVEK